MPNDNITMQAIRVALDILLGVTAKLTDRPEFSRLQELISEASDELKELYTITWYRSK